MGKLVNFDVVCEMVKCFINFLILYIHLHDAFDVAVSNSMQNVFHIVQYQILSSPFEFYEWWSIAAQIRSYEFALWCCLTPVTNRISLFKVTFSLLFSMNVSDGTFPTGRLVRKHVEEVANHDQLCVAQGLLTRTTKSSPTKFVTLCQNQSKHVSAMRLTVPRTEQLIGLRYNMYNMIFLFN